LGPHCMRVSLRPSV